MNMDKHYETRTLKSRDDYATPWPIVRYLESLVGKFDVDACATKETAKAPEWYGPGSKIDRDALHEDVLWGGNECGEVNIFCNPPYNDLRSWCAKAFQAAQCGRKVAMLIPSRTDTKAFHSMKKETSGYVFFQGRISFEVDGVPQKGTMFPSVAVLLGGENSWRREKQVEYPEVKWIMDKFKEGA
jgi:phage N-6-adenine-methyltransferase